MADPRMAELEKVRQFRKLVTETIAAFRNAQSQSALASALDERIPAWEKADAEFAGLLREVRGQAYAMSLTHLKSVVYRLCEHLQVNLDRVDRESRSLG